jgi:hypothetical protein
MAVGAVLGIIVLGMFRRCCGVIILCMAVITKHTLGFPAELGCGGMALAALGGKMRTYQWKPALLMDLGDVLDDPGAGCMASPAIGADSLVVHVGMAVQACSSGLGKHQRLMALPAGRDLMLAGERKGCLAVIKGIDGLVKCPAFGTMAKFTAKFEILAVG